MARGYTNGSERKLRILPCKNVKSAEMLAMNGSKNSGKITAPSERSVQRSKTPSTMEWTNYLSQDVKGPSGCSFAIVWASVTDSQDVELKARRLSLTEREHFHQKKQNVLEDFWTAMGFRRTGSSTFFCFAKNPNHPSHSLL